MHALPFTLALLLALALMGLRSSTLGITETIHAQSWSAFYRCQRALACELARAEYKRYYNRSRTPPQPGKEDVLEEISKKVDPRPASELIPHRERRPLYAAHGINLYPLLHERDRAGWEMLRAAIASWLDQLYREASFFYPGLGNDFLQHLLDSARSHPELTSIPQLLDTTGAYCGPFYKMVQGSVTFDKSDSLLCPPLERLVVIDPKQPQVLFIWQYATPSLLTALLDEPTASQLIQAERDYMKGHSHPLPAQQVEELLSNDLEALGRWHTLQAWMIERPPDTLQKAPVEAVEQQGATRALR